MEINNILKITVITAFAGVAILLVILVGLLDYKDILAQVYDNRPDTYKYKAYIEVLESNYTVRFVGNISITKINRSCDFVNVNIANILVTNGSACIGNYTALVQFDPYILAYYLKSSEKSKGIILYKKKVKYYDKEFTCNRLIILLRNDTNIVYCLRDSKVIYFKAVENKTNGRALVLLGPVG